MTPGQVAAHRAAMATFARRALPFIAGAFVACTVIQVFLAGLGVFDDPGSFITHREFGYTFGWLTLVILVLAIVGRTGRRIIGLSVLLLVLFTLQSVFIALRTDMPAVAALHPLNGFLIMLTSIVLTRVSWQARHVAVPSPSTPASAAQPATNEAS
jgi:uncharacterized protein DUF6220